MVSLAHRYLSLLLATTREIPPLLLMRLVSMQKDLKFPLNFWNKKDFWFQQRSAPIISKYCQTYPNVYILIQMTEKATRGVSAGVKGFECGIKGRPAPTECRSSIFIAVCYDSNVVIPILAHSSIDFNSFARCYPHEK